MISLIINYLVPNKIQVLIVAQIEGGGTSNTKRKDMLSYLDHLIALHFLCV